MKRFWVRAGFLLFLVILSAGFLVPSAPPPLLAQQSTQASPILIADTMVGRPVAVGDYVFWVDGRDYNNAIYGYHIPEQREFFVTDLGTPTGVPWRRMGKRWPGLMRAFAYNGFKAII